MLQQRGALTFNEISQQNESWTDTLKIVNEKMAELVSWFSKEAFNQVVFTGSGSSFHAAGVSSIFFGNLTGVATSWFPAAEVFSLPRLPFDVRRKTLVVVFSRSGETQETAWAISRIKEKVASTKFLLITPNSSGPLAELCDQHIFLPKAKEESHVSTKAYTSMILALKLLTAVLMKNTSLYNELMSLPGKLEIKKFQKEIQKVVGVKPVHLVVCGNGIYYPHAMEGSSLIKKMSSISAESNYTSELRHGDANHTTQTMIAVLLSGEAMRKADGQIISDLAQTKCHRLVVCDKSDNRLGLSDFIVEIGSGLSDLTRDLLYVPVLQELAFYLSVSKAYNADKPKHVHYAVTWKEHF